MTMMLKNNYLWVAIAASAFSSQPLLAHTSHGSVQIDGRFTPNVEGAQFPPQPQEMDAVEFFKPDNSVSQAQSNQRNGTSGESLALLEQMAKDPEISDALGDDYLLLSEQPVIEKWATDDADVRLFVFFSYSKNHTLEVTTNNGVIENRHVVAAGDSQPPLAQLEMTRAIDIATAHWRAVPTSNVTQLVGYAIQTFEEDGSAYDTRVAYVSFHIASPELPSLLTWVDLNTGKVLKAERAQ